MLSVSGAGGAPCIAQGRKPSQRVAAVNTVMHQEASDEGVHLRSPGPIETGETLERGLMFRPVCERAEISLPEMFYGFTNFGICIFDIR